MLPVALAAMLLAPKGGGSTYVEVEKTCPIGGETFKHMELMSISTFGQMPDGMPIGSGTFPIELPQCPGNGAVMYADLDAARWQALAPYVAGADYQAMRKTETRYYLAYRLAGAAGDAQSQPWLLLSATWEAKNAGDAARARRYMEAFVALARAMPADDASSESIGMRAWGANALRELGRFDEAEAMRAKIRLSRRLDADERAGWTKYLKLLGGAIARRDAGRAPIDLLPEQQAALRCLGPAPGDPPQPALSAFEQDYCAGPALREEIAATRKVRG